MPSSSKTITVLLADDHPIVRRGVRFLLEEEPDLRVVGEAGDGREAIEKVRELSPDVLVMDISMPGLNGVEATRHIAQTFPQTQVVALSVHSSGRFIKDMFEAGARGYLLKESAPEELSAAVHTVIRGEVFLSGSIAGKVVSGFVDRQADAPGAVDQEEESRNEERPSTVKLMHTKFHRPAIPKDYVHRHRLVERLQDSLHQTLTLISAPAGYGKSTLVSSWLQSSGRTSAWLSLEKEDDNPHRFVACLLGAIESLLPDAVSGTSTMAHRAEMPFVNQLSASLIEELGRIEEDCILVLDNVEHLGHSFIFAMLHRLIDRQPATMHLVLIGRRDPFLPISRLRAQGRITEIRTTDLRFTPEETAVFLKGALEREVDGALAASWAEKTEGWITGLHLAAMAMRRWSDSTFPQDLPDSVQYVLEYLFNDVLSNQSAEIHRWLLSASILDRFCAPLCDAVMGTGDGPGDAAMNGWEFIRFLQNENLFIVDLDSEKRWFRFHHFFKRLLKNQMLRHKRPEDVAALHQRASNWFEQEGMIKEALAHALQAGNTAHAVRLVGQHRRRLWNTGRLYDFQQWLSLFPEDACNRHPDLLLAQTLLVFFRSRFEHIEPLVERAETLIENHPGAASLDVEIEFFRGVLQLVQGDGEASRVRLKNALGGISSGQQALNGLALTYLGLAEQMGGRMERGVQMLSSRYDDPSTPYRCRVWVITALIWIHLIAGDLDGASLYIRQQRDLADQGREHPLRAMGDYAQGMIHFHRHEFDAAIRCFTRSLQYGDLLLRRLLFDCMAGLAMAHQANGRQERADAALQRLFDYCHETGDVGSLALAASCRHRLQLTSTPAPAAGAEKAKPPADDAPPPAEAMFWWLEVPAITDCRVLMASGAPVGFLQAESRLRALLQFNEAHHNRCQAIQIMPLLAVSVHRQGRSDEALEILANVVRLAEPGGWIRPFVEAGPAMAVLLEGLKNMGPAQGFIDRLRSAFQDSGSASVDPGAQTVSARPSDPPSMVEPLTNRECDILELLARRWQNKEIAGRLCISSETVKSHLKHMYQKLDAPNRMKAVEKARRLGLLPDRQS